MRHPITRRRAFTLIELIIVLVIIAILVGLLAPALNRAIRYTRESAAIAEMNVMTQALADFRSQYGDFPPSRIVLCEDGDYTAAHFKAILPPAQAAEAIALTGRSLSYLRKFFPRMQLGTGCPVGIPFYDFNGNGIDDTKLANPAQRVAILHGDECLVFFIGGVPLGGGPGVWNPNGFSRTPNNPFDNNQNRTSSQFQFSPDRLVDSEGFGYPYFKDTFTGRPVVYFSAYGNSYDPDDVNDASEPVVAFQTGNHPTGVVIPPPGPTPYVWPSNLIASPGPNPYTSGDSWNGVFLKKDSFQLIEAGIDGQYGPGGQFDSRDGAPPLPIDLVKTLAATGVALPENVRSTELDNLTGFFRSRLGQ